MRVGVFDGVSGASGDMIVASLLDAGWSLDGLRRAVQHLPVQPQQITAQRVTKGSLAATQVQFDVDADQPLRRLPDILRVLQAGHLSPSTLERAIKVFERLASAEAAIHAVSIDEIHFHELSGLDTLLDIVGTLAGLEALEINQVYVSPLNVGSGYVMTAHGTVPVPAPATISLLRGFNVYADGEPGERVTPTGAALLTTFGSPVTMVPPLRVDAIGYGAGQKDFDTPNVLRLVVGEQIGDADGESLVELVCNIDDMSPELLGYVTERLLADGALDTYLAPIVMKKGRPATCLSVLCRHDTCARLRTIIFEETTTLGVRERLVRRYALARHSTTVDTPYGPIRLKIAARPNDRTTASPEYDDCRMAARTANVPLQLVYQAALRAFESRSEA